MARNRRMALQPIAGFFVHAAQEPHHRRSLASASATCTPLDRFPLPSLRANTSSSGGRAMLPMMYFFFGGFGGRPILGFMGSYFLKSNSDNHRFQATRFRPIGTFAGNTQAQAR